MNVSMIKRPVNYVLSTFSILMMAVLVVCVIWQVFSRNVLQMPSTVTDEIARFSMIWVALLGAAYTVGTQKHLSIDLLTSNLVGRKKYLSDMVIYLVVFMFALIAMVYGGGMQTLKIFASSQVSSALRISMGWFYLSIPVSGVLIIFYSTLYVLDSAIKLVRTPMSEVL